MFSHKVKFKEGGGSAARKMEIEEGGIHPRRMCRKQNKRSSPNLTEQIGLEKRYGRYGCGSFSKGGLPPKGRLQTAYTRTTKQTTGTGNTKEGKTTVGINRAEEGTIERRERESTRGVEEERRGG